MTDEIRRLVEQSMVGTANFYAAKGEMAAACAVQDAFLVLMAAVDNPVEVAATETTVKEW